MENTHPGRTFGLLTIPCPAGFVPASERSMPRGCCSNLPAAVLRAWAAIYNASEAAQETGRWAVYASNGELLLIDDIPGESRPAAPTDFPPGTELVAAESWKQALRQATERNAERFRVAKVPREWTIPLQSLATGTEYAGALPHLERSPERLEPLANDFWAAREPEIDELTELLPENVSLLATVGATSGVGLPIQPLTDAERRLATLEVTPQTFDLTGDLRQQIAAILEELAMQCLQSAIQIRKPEPAEVSAAA